MENLLILNKSREGGILISVFQNKQLILERKIDFLFFDNKNDREKLFSIIKADWKIDLSFKSGSSFRNEKIFIIKNEDFLFSSIEKRKQKANK